MLESSFRLFPRKRESRNWSPLVRRRTGVFYAAVTFMVLALESASVFARADDYPSRPVTLIVPFPPGGSTTVMARIVADKLSAALGQQIVVENRGGAGGTIGTRVAAKPRPMATPFC
jgi:tripartite-type tricarboxylate transporter receptor subunit TctC